MQKNARRKTAGHVFDRAGLIIDGVIDNGRLLLMIGLVLSFSFMVSELSDLAASRDDSVPAAATEPGEPQEAIPGSRNAAVTRIQDRSDYRIRMHVLCADEDFRNRNAKRCERLLRGVENAVRDATLDEVRKDSLSHDDDTSLTLPGVSSPTRGIVMASYRTTT
jgi:hypothetical protein